MAPLLYRISFAPSAVRGLAKLPGPAQQRIKACVDALASEPRPRGAVKLQGAEGVYGLRVGTYRVLYRVDDRVLLVLVVKVGHRRDVYRVG